ncbi:hypothetical protein GGR51DRAFT_577299 [Nemania sp. FL0031]|nr:hypothetical protein GGR51DRAFT_577299 [Nemania sp. FL0031]
MATAEMKDEFNRLLIQKDSESGVSVQNVLAESTIGIDDDKFDTWCTELWKSTLNSCKARLAPKDFEIARQFGSPEKLIESLKQMQRPPNNTFEYGFQYLMYQVHHMEHSVRHQLAVFIFTILPWCVETGIVWGFMYLVIELSSEQEAASTKLLGMFLKVRHQMAVLKRNASKIENLAETSQDRPELSIMFIAIFEALLFFWRDCVGCFRKSPPWRFRLQSTTGWTEIQKSYAETLHQIQDATEYLSVNAAIDAASAAAAQLPATRFWDDEAKFSTLHLLPESRTSLFLGRDDILSDIDSYLGLPSRPRDKLAVYAMCGIGGVGKTEIAREYAHRNKGNFDAILWVGSESQESLRTGFTRIALELGLPGADLKAHPTHNLALVHRWLRVTGRTWLLILDNVEKYVDITTYLPIGSRGPVIVTTRYINQAKMFKGRHQTVGKLDSRTAENLFLQLITTTAVPGATPATRVTIGQLPGPEREAVQFLLSDIEGLALGINQMAAMIKSQNHQNNIAKFTARYKRDLPTVLQRQEGIKGHTLSTLWNISFETVRNHPPAFILLGVLSCVQPDEIPKALFQPPNVSTLGSDMAFCTDGLMLDETAAFLKALGLIGANNHSFSLHRLVQVAFMMQLNSEERQRIVDSASSLLQLASPNKGYGGLCDTWPQHQKYVQHGAALASWFEKLATTGQKVASSPAFVNLILSCAWYLIESGSEREACSLFEIALDAHGPKFDLEEGDLLNGLGMAYFSLNEIHKSRNCLTRSQRIRKSLLKPNDLYLATTFQNMGNVDYAEGSFQSAILNFEKSISIRETHNGNFVAAMANPNDERTKAEKAHHTSIAATYLSKARAYLETSNYELAFSNLKLSLSFFERGQCRDALGCFSSYLYGNLYFRKQDYSTAIANYRAALKQAHGSTREQLPLEVSCHYKIGTAQFRLHNFHAAMLGFIV